MGIKTYGHMLAVLIDKAKPELGKQLSNYVPKQL